MLSIGIRSGIARQRSRGRRFYVDPNGNDSNTGRSPSTAWQTLAKVNSYLSTIGLKRYDRVRFNGGSTLLGSLFLDNTASSNVNGDYFFESYGAGRATLKANASAVTVNIYNNIASFKNLLIDQSFDSTKPAMQFFSDAAINYKGFSISFCDALNGREGIILYITAGTYNNTIIQGCNVPSARRSAIVSAADAGQPIKNLLVRHCSVSNIIGLGTVNTGNGIVLGNVINALIERCVADGAGSTNGSNNNLIWFNSARNSIIRDCIAKNNVGIGPADAGAYGFDVDCQDCIIERNFAYNCQGLALLVYNGNRNIARQNLFVDCAKTRSAGSIYIYGGNNSEPALNVQIINNTVVQKTNSVPLVFNRLGNTTGYIGNNILINASTVKMVDSPTAALQFINNQYYSSIGASTFVWNGTTYTGIGNWRGVNGNQEKIGATNYGAESNPLLSNLAGTAPIDFKLTAASPSTVKTGADLLTLLNLNPGIKDYFGNSLVGKIPAIGADSSYA